MTLLEVDDLLVEYASAEGPVRAVDGVSFTIDDGETVGIVGESGCGKSTLAHAIIGTLPSAGAVKRGTIRFRGKDLIGLSERKRRRHRWKDISLIPQSAMNALDPVYTVGDQIVEAIQTHHPREKEGMARETVAELFELVGLDPARARDYPHQFSGGMRQRAMIAMALALDPSLILADEPTTALDVIMQDQILRRIGEVQDETGASMLVITHDVAVVAETCERVIVMYAGQLVEEGPVERVFGRPNHPYTIGLQSAFPNIHEPERKPVSIAGTPPGLIDPPTGCRFARRCPMATQQCIDTDPSWRSVSGTETRCHHADRLDMELRPVARDATTWATARGSESDD